MNKVRNAVIIILMIAGLTEQARAEGSFWDKATNQEHITSGYAFSVSSYLIYKNKLELSTEKSLILSAGTAFLLSALRDKYLFKTDQALYSDHLKATAMGVSIGTVFSITLDF